MPTLSSTRTNPLTALSGKAEKCCPQASERTRNETRQVIVPDADKTEGKDQDLVNGDGGTLVKGV